MSDQPDGLFSVEDQIVLLTGGSRGIGAAIAKGFAARGARVIICGREMETLQNAAAGMPGRHPVRPWQCDIAKPKEIQKMVAGTENEVGPIDTLVNVAGVNRRKPALEMSEEDFDFILDINLKGAFVVSQAVGKGMVERGKGCQIHIASLTTDRPLTHVLPYSASKAGIGQMTRALAQEWGPHGVRVNALAPGFILTDLTQKMWSFPEMQAWADANTPQKRLGTPEDMVGTALFLASPASQFMTGQILYVDGGFNAGWTWPIPAKSQ